MSDLSERTRILVVDDRNHRESLRVAEKTATRWGRPGRATAVEETPLALVDPAGRLKMPGMDGLQVLEEVKSSSPTPQW